MRKILRASLTVSLILTALSFSSEGKALDGVPYVDYEIHGVTYHVPIPNSRVQDDFLLLKKATMGDTFSRDFLLQGQERRWFYIGDIGVNRWVIITKHDITVKDVK